MTDSVSEGNAICAIQRATTSQDRLSASLAWLDREPGNEARDAASAIRAGVRPSRMTLGWLAERALDGSLVARLVLGVSEGLDRHG